MKKLVILLIFCLISLIIYAEVKAPTNTSIIPSIPTFSPTKTISLNFVGDILAARTIETTMRRAGYDYPFAKIQSELANADITFANLETPLIGNAATGKTTPGGLTQFRGDVDFAAALKRAGIDIVSIANNHMKDQGEAGIRSTINALDQVELAHVGAGMNLEEARGLKIMEIVTEIGKPIKVGYIAYNDADVVPSTSHATDKQSGTNIMNTPRLREDVAAARPQVDVLIISMHSGVEYVTAHANTKQTDFAHAAIEAGADMVIGHHPHVLQPMEIYKGKYIFYSLGNFVFDQPWPDTKESALIHMRIDLKEVNGKWNISAISPHILPLIIQNFQPQKTTNEAKMKQILTRFSKVPQVLSLGSQSVFVELATSTEAQAQGLSDRKSLPQNTGLLFVFDTPNRTGFWMKDMLFPIDIFWFDSQFKLVDKRLSVDPSTYPNVFYPNSDAMYVLETAVGVLDTMSLTKDLTGELTLLESYDKR
ncbi:MAG: CapA family protein [Patescibacteria group bacterium]